MHLATRILLPFSLAVTCHGYSTFETNCSIPSISFNFVSSPESRGTLDILWSSIFTIVACTWTILHLNVPEQRKKKDLGHGLWCDFKWTLKGVWTNLKWMLFTMIAPEFILGKAIGDLASAWECRELMRPFAKEDHVDWGLGHGFYANMGGFVGVDEDKIVNKEDQEEEILADPIPLTACGIYLLRKTERVRASDKESSEPENKKRSTKLEKLPDITNAELYDKSKGDIFVKAIAISQVFWVALQIIVRVRKGLEISQLELAVAAFAVCAIFTYLVLLSKPQGVRVPSRPIVWEPGSVKGVIEASDEAMLREIFLPSRYIVSKERNRVVNDAVHMQISSNADANYVGMAYVLGLTFGSIVFGSIHIAGWNLKFPTPTEQILWRVSSVLLATLLLAPLVPLCLASYSAELMDFLDPYESLWRFLNLVLGVLYVAARLFILVEVFRTLLFLPPGAYVSTWASYVPHVT